MKGDFMASEKTAVVKDKERSTRLDSKEKDKRNQKPCRGNGKNGH